MRALKRFWFAPACALVALAAAACNGDDATVTARAQGRVNLAMSRDSDVQVVVRDGQATLTGVASSEAMRTHAEEVVRAVQGVRTVQDEIALPPTLTGATVPR